MRSFLFLLPLFLMHSYSFSGPLYEEYLSKHLLGSWSTDRKKDGASLNVSISVESNSVIRMHFLFKKDEKIGYASFEGAWFVRVSHLTLIVKKSTQPDIFGIGEVYRYHIRSGNSNRIELELDEVWEKDQTAF
jgi:hypothetical protein